MKLHCWESSDKLESEEGISISEAKKLLKERGGYASTFHIDRDGCVFETTPIKLNRNNSVHHYNKHL